MGTKKTDPIERLDKLAIDVCVPQADEYKRRTHTTRGQAMIYGDGVKMGFVAGYVTRHYLRPEDPSVGIEAEDLLDTIKATYPKLHETLESLLEDDDLEDLFDEAPEEHAND